MTTVITTNINLEENARVIKALDSKIAELKELREEKVAEVKEVMTKKKKKGVNSLPKIYKL